MSRAGRRRATRASRGRYAPSLRHDAALRQVKSWATSGPTHCTNSAGELFAYYWLQSLRRS
jgi:hypothetical protein